jgi:peptidoglycan/LPS O-acetylase OafA/YrhL
LTSRDIKTARAFPANGIATATLTKYQSALLDLLRGVAAQLVVLGHVYSVSGFNQTILVQDLGVVVFFVLSGFLITFSAMAKTNYTFVDFFIDRAARLFTPYIPALIFIWLAGMMLGLGGRYDAYTFFMNTLMLQDIPAHTRFLPEIDRVGTGRPLWSVAMEWWIYMAFGLLFFRRIPLWSWPLAALGVWVAGYHAVHGSLTLTWFAGALCLFLFRMKDLP